MKPETPIEIYSVAAPTSYDPRSDTAPDASHTTPSNAYCPVYGAFPSRAPDWAAQVIFADGGAYSFDSPLSLFTCLCNLPRYAVGRRSADIVATYVRAVDNRRWIAALQTVYMWGSDVSGLVRRGNLPVFRNHTDARDFITRHDGSVMNSASITTERPQALEPSQSRPAGRYTQRIPVWLWGDVDCTVQIMLT